MGRRIASQSKQTVRGGPKPAKVGLHRRLALRMLSKLLLQNINKVFRISRRNLLLFTLKSN